jgi:hypothetical protein
MYPLALDCDENLHDNRVSGKCHALFNKVSALGDALARKLRAGIDAILIYCAKFGNDLGRQDSRKLCGLRLEAP